MASAPGIVVEETRAVMVGGSIWDDGIRVSDESGEPQIYGSAAGAGAGTGASRADSVAAQHARAVRAAKAEREKRRRASAAHYAIVGRAPTDVKAYAASPDLPPPTTSARLPARKLLNLYVAQVGRYQFKLMHRMEGRWNGEAIVYDGSSDSEKRVVSVELKFNEKRRHWTERQTLTSDSGIASTQVLRLDPVGDGMLAVSTDDPMLADVVDMRVEEHSENIMMLTAISHKTGQPLIVETVTLMDDLRRVRTVQRFSESGSFKCLYHIRETRVIDSVSGAVEEVPPRERR